MKNGNINIKQEINKTVRQALRDDQLKNSFGFVSKNKTFKSKKEYKRLKIKINETIS